MKTTAYSFLLVWLMFACKKNSIHTEPGTIDTTVFSITSNKAVYLPNETVSFQLNALPLKAFVRYRYLNQVLKEEALTGTWWTWTLPAGDFMGYSVEVFSKENNLETTKAGIAVDVSSDWRKFPRYGFLSEFGQKAGSEMDGVIAFLSRCHINGLQFYDWHYKHHQPVSGTVQSPAASWKDIANRDSYKATVQGYIDRAHQKGMQAMFYNLCYGALQDAETDGVQPQWYMYTDALHQHKDYIGLPKPLFKSDIFFTDPSSTGWQQYLAEKNKDVYQVYNFDGFHVDQVGDRGTVYTYDGDALPLANSFSSFLTAMQAAQPSKKLVMNAVNQFGQSSIAAAPVDFLYSELWSGNEGYKDLAAVIQHNANYANAKSTVLAAYVNYNKSANPGHFNTPGVLLANAVIFAFGGSHIELGEHMLCSEYFPNNNLTMDAELTTAIIAYYDFLTAYQNLLRDGGTYNSAVAACSNGKMALTAWPPAKGQVAVQGKQTGTKQVLHFINFTNATSTGWRDTDGTQPPPANITNAAIEVNYTRSVTKLWWASPDANAGIPQELSFTQTGGKLKFTLPSLKYWDMVVIE